MLSSTERKLYGRIGAYRQHSRHSPVETTAVARATFLSSFEREVDPDGVLSSEERARRATAAHKAHMTRLALLSVKVRRERKEQGLPERVEDPSALRRIAGLVTAEGGGGNA